MKSFYSKILLFGEYSVIQNSLALSIPYKLFEGQLTFKRERTDHANVDQELKTFAQYLKNLEKQNKLDFDFDVTSFEFDVAQGLRFDSSIPQGYGVGSSGALCAALFARYGSIPIKENIPQLKDIFSSMESHFHGASSGIDPLISFLNAPILIKGKEDFGRVNIPEFKVGKAPAVTLSCSRTRHSSKAVKPRFKSTPARTPYTPKNPAGEPERDHTSASQMAASVAATIISCGRL